MPVVSRGCPIRQTPLWAACLAPFVLTACGEPLSNAIFEEDAAFRAALPTAAQVRLALPEGAQAKMEAECEPGDLYALTFNTMAYVNGVTQDLLTTVEGISAKPITSRTQQSRTWGPHFAQGPGLWMTLTIERREVREADRLELWYFYWLTASQAQSDPGEAVLWGQWDPDFEPIEGVGELTWDQGFFSSLGEGREVEGQVTATYDTRDGGRQVQALIDDVREVGAPEGSGVTVDCAYAQEGGGGWFSYENRSNIVQETDAKEQLEVTSRWLPSGAGRSEGRYADGDLGIVVVSLIECWDALACTTFYRDSADMQPQVGQASMCPFGGVEM